MTAQPARFDAVFLDLDATILDEKYIEIASVAACVELAGRHPDIDPRALALANYETWLSYWPEIEDDWILGDLVTSDLRHEVWRRTLEQLGRVEPELVDEVSEIHHRHELDNYLVFDDVVPLLDALQANGVKVAVLTNGATDTQREKLNALELTGRFDAIIVSGEHGAAKPDRTIFERALEAVGVRADRAAHIGDSLKADVAGAVATGVTAVWLNRTDAARQTDHAVPDLEVSSLAELIELWGLAR
jgi:putative hydrolase of the HAD superfamily